MTSKTKLEKIIKLAAPMLKPYLKFADSYGILAAIATVESSFGTNNISRFEKVYAPGGSYYNADQKERHLKWGAGACCSFSSFQILYPTACELGFDSSPYNRDPHELSNDEVAIFYVIEYIKNRVLAKGADTIEKLFDAYNSGTFKDDNIPHNYIRAALQAYNSNSHVDYHTA